MPKNTVLSRRHFLVGSGMLAGATVLPAMNARGETTEPAASPPGVTYRQMGKTDLRLSTVSLGTGPGQDVNVMRFAMKQGITFIHTSTGYAGGRAIRNVGEAIKGQREKVVLGLKITWDPKDMNAFKSALEILGTDHVDIAFFNIHAAGTVKQQKWQDAAKALKAAGLTQAIGLTSHKDVVNCMQAALDQGFYDVLMPSYNLGEEEAFKPVFARAEEAGVGVVLMKTGRGLHGDDYRKAVPRYLTTPAVTTINKGLNSFADITRQIEDAAAELTAADQARLDEVARFAMVGRCHMCGACGEVCPQGVSVPDVVRCSEYYLEDSSLYVTARETFDAITRPRLTSCGSCARCEQACPYAVPVKHHLRRAEAMLT